MSTANIVYPFSFLKGTPYPLGATYQPDHSVNFAVAAAAPAHVELCLFSDPSNPTRETARIPLTDRHGDIRFLRVRGIPEGSTYAYRVDGPWDPHAGEYFNPHKLLLDPYAKHIDGPSKYHPSLRSRTESGERDVIDSAPHAPRGVVPRRDDYDWEGDTQLRIPMNESVIYEMHVKGFSMLNPAVPEELRGSYAGLAHSASIDYLKDLGITAVQLLPVHQHLDDGFLLERGLVNYWGYNTLGFFAPEARYAVSKDPVTEFRNMVKTLHRAGIEVIIDVVYNHTCEAGPDGPTCFLRGFDNLTYYHSVPARPGHYIDYTGCGNSVDLSHPRGLRLVMDSLRYWVEEMHVDGFRFDLAVELGRDAEGYNRRSTFFQALHQDPVLAGIKLIAEPWDLGYGGYQIGNFPIDWAELNGKFRDGVRRFWRGDPKTSGEFASRITGSEDLFAHNHRTPPASVNLITSHDGFTLLDLVSYNQKHNLANGERNADGDSHNISYNHGVEGPSDDPTIRELRHRQVRNFLATTICSQGVPFLLSGDERYRTQGGNNNSYCQDNEISWISWKETEETVSLRQFVKRLLRLRRDYPSLRRTSFFTGQAEGALEQPDICWFRHDAKKKESDDWRLNPTGSFSVMIGRNASPGALLFFFNARHETRKFSFPKALRCNWVLVADTAAPLRQGARASHLGTSDLVHRSMQIWKQSPMMSGQVKTSRLVARRRSSQRENPLAQILQARRQPRKSVSKGSLGRISRARRTSSL